MITNGCFDVNFGANVNDFLAFGGVQIPTPNLE